ncbi:MAG: GNAT family N-acetyltransferase [Ruminococcus sp.]|nr:GNAT family N-acetyltransferase [Ruminococcus sp.]MBQ9079095.1 GNAT family N-acetyltransferase [Ruminococcus sp.]
MVNFTLRKAHADDKKRIEELFIAMLESIYTEAQNGYETGYLNKFFTGGDDWICVAECNDTIIGYIAIEVHNEPEKFVYLDDISVSEAFRSQGIGSALIKKAESYASVINAAYIALHVEVSNTSALKLYERLGYSVRRNEENRLFMRHDI